MLHLHKRTIVAAGAALALLVGAGAAAAAPQAGPRFGGPGYGMMGGGYGVMAGGVMMDAAADYVGISESELIAARHSGKSLAQIATEHGKTAAGLEQAIVAAYKANLDRAVDAGRITQAQAAQALAAFQANVKAMVEQSGVGPRMGGGFGGGFGHCRGGAF